MIPAVEERFCILLVYFGFNELNIAFTTSSSAIYRTETPLSWASLIALAIVASDAL